MGLNCYFFLKEVICCWYIMTIKVMNFYPMWENIRLNQTDSVASIKFFFNNEPIMVSLLESPVRTNNDLTSEEELACVL